MTFGYEVAVFVNISSVRIFGNKSSYCFKWSEGLYVLTCKNIPESGPNKGKKKKHI